MTGPFSEAESRIMWLEHIAGLTPITASRPMLPHEIKAVMDFAGIDANLQAGQQKAAMTLDQVRDIIVTEMIDAVSQADTPEQAAKILADFTATQPLAVQQAIADAGKFITATLVDLYDTGAVDLLRSAGHQGVDTTTIDPVLAEADMWATHGSLAPSWLWTKLSQAALAVGGARPAPVADIAAGLMGTSLAGAYDLTRQAATLAYSTGRRDQIPTLPEPAAIYASELLDGATCEPCAAIDGTEYASMDEALADYPDGGIYHDCDGGDRCRGTLVITWSTEDNPISGPALGD